MIRQGREKTAFGLTGQGFHSFDETKRFLKFYPSLRVVPKVPTLSFYTKKFESPTDLTPRATTALRPTTFSREPELMIGDLLPR